MTTDLNLVLIKYSRLNPGDVNGSIYLNKYQFFTYNRISIGHQVYLYLKNHNSSPLDQFASNIDFDWGDSGEPRECSKLGFEILS